MSETAALLGGPKAVSAEAPPWPLVDGETLAEITRVITQETLCPVGAEGTQGEFERAFAEMHGRKYGLAVNGGTAALMLGAPRRRGAAGRRGDCVAVHVGRVRELHPPELRDPRVRRHRPAHVHAGP